MPNHDENPKTRRESKKTDKEKKSGKDRLGSGKGARALEANQERAKGNQSKKNTSKSKWNLFLLWFPVSAHTPLLRTLAVSKRLFGIEKKLNRLGPAIVVPPFSVYIFQLP